MAAPSLTRSDHRASGLEALTNGFMKFVMGSKSTWLASSRLAGFECFRSGVPCQ